MFLSLDPYKYHVTNHSGASRWMSSWQWWVSVVASQEHMSCITWKSVKRENHTDYFRLLRDFRLTRHRQNIYFKIMNLSKSLVMNLKCTWVSAKQGVWCLGVLVEMHCWTENPFSKWEAICPRKRLSCVSLIVWCDKWWLSLIRWLISHECPIWRMVWCSEMLSFHYICSRAYNTFLPPDISTPSWNRKPLRSRHAVSCSQRAKEARVELQRWSVTSLSHNLGHQTLANLQVIREHF